MTDGPPRPPGGLPRRAAVLCAVALALTSDGTGSAAPLPTLVLSPNNGTPGSVIAARGAGFCGVPDCSPLDLLFAGMPVAQAVPVARDGSFRTSFRVPGGGVVGVQNVVATQTRSDGYEVSAAADFDLVFSRGEQAELLAELADRLAEPTASPGTAPGGDDPAATGGPVAAPGSGATGLTPTPTSTAPGGARGAAASSWREAAGGAVDHRWWLALVVGGPLAVLLSLAAWRLRRAGRGAA